MKFVAEAAPIGGLHEARHKTVEREKRVGVCPNGLPPEPIGQNLPIRYLDPPLFRPSNEARKGFGSKMLGPRLGKSERDVGKVDLAAARDVDHHV